jgi:hypothetical protein
MHTWGKSEGRGGISVSRIVSIATLAISIVALVLALKRPHPMASPQPPETLASNAQSFQTKVDQLQQAQAQGQTGSEVHLTANEIGAAIAQTVAAPVSQARSTPPKPGDAPDPSAEVASGSIDQVNLQEPIISFEGDIVRGQFVNEIAGKKVYITVAGHLGSKDGYATFQPTEFKVGDLNIPVSLINEALQKKMTEQRDRLKLPDFVSDVRVENGELVIKRK